MDAKALAEYMAIPYKVNGRSLDDGGVDCWGLVRLILAEQRGIHLPSYDMYGEKIRLHSGSMVPQIAPEAEEHGWSPVDPPLKRWDLVFFQVGVELHIGLMLDETNFLSALPKVGPVVYPTNRQVWARTRIGAYRHRTQL